MIHNPKDLSPDQKLAIERLLGRPSVGGGDEPERSVEELKRLSGKGHSRGWRFNRDEIHQR